MKKGSSCVPPVSRPTMTTILMASSCVVEDADLRSWIELGSFPFAMWRRSKLLNKFLLPQHTAAEGFFSLLMSSSSSALHRRISLPLSSLDWLYCQQSLQLNGARQMIILYGDVRLSLLLLAINLSGNKKWMENENLQLRKCQAAGTQFIANDV